MAQLELNDAIRRVDSLRQTLRSVNQLDQEQEVIGMGIQTIDAVLTAAGDLIPDGDPVLERLADVFSPEAIIAGESMRVFELLLLVDQVRDALAAERNRRDPPPRRFVHR